ncbi:putative Calcium-binding mitochondrial carrier protein Aralar2 [Glarea lozoyensis 74030]|uniref:Mitochondrial aspartate-glutamate transporter AGC1 n=1 Tax=Glarea lozoyensis (strain ATCC 74030 / MF5533) TaxID=1104152 RepID=H0EQ01_GLAL7|nr:putative Calcium-binding mitochondrial carrier protein Aralar2 [Glarea lozoyensis 74030]
MATVSTEVTKVKEVVKESLLGSEVPEDAMMSARSKATFIDNAKKDPETGELFMGEEEFINAVAPEGEDYHKIKREQYAILFRVADRRDTGKINLLDWGTFENLLAKPDAEYEIAFRLFDNMIREMDLVELIIRQATAQSSDGKITRTDFLNEAARITRFSLFTPMEADILFHFASLDEPSGKLGLSDFAKVLDPSWRNPLYNAFSQATGAGATAVKVKTQGILHSVLESVHHFGLGSLAGAFGAFMVYPIDLVKTRMQNQRSSRVGEMLYKNSLDCAKKVIKNEGFKGLYSGVLPQLVGVAPEKAIKLTVNDLVRGHFSGKDGKIWIPHEILAGGTAGACQVIFTNPLEIVKIRLQVQGEVAKNVDGAPRRSAMWIVRNLGLVGLYKGASACLLRDVPFSAIYFPTYNHLKRDIYGESPTKKLGILQLLTAGAIAGMPAAYLTTPCDVIKTRLQVEARKEEGFKAFFKGGPARILRSSPQFGFTLAMYEVLQNLLPMPGSEKAEESAMHKGVVAAGEGLPGQDGPIGFLRSRNALKIILDLDGGFGGVGGMPGGKEGWRGVPKVLGGGK